MDKTLKRGSLEMIAAMLISGTIGWFVLVSGQSVIDVVFWRCVIGGAMLLLVCAALGLLRRELLSRRVLVLALVSGVAIVGNWLLLFASYSKASIAISTAVYNVQPFMLVGLARCSSASASPWPSWPGWVWPSSACWPSSVPMAIAAPRARTTCWASPWPWARRCSMQWRR